MRRGRARRPQGGGGGRSDQLSPGWSLTRSHLHRPELSVNHHKHHHHLQHRSHCYYSSLRSRHSGIEGVLSRLCCCLYTGTGGRLHSAGPGRRGEHSGWRGPQPGLGRTRKLRCRRSTSCPASGSDTTSGLWANSLFCFIICT